MQSKNTSPVPAGNRTQLAVSTEKHVDVKATLNLDLRLGLRMGFSVMFHSDA